MRTCIGCGRRAPQDTLVRLAHNGADAIVADRQRHQSGRGCYWCGDEKCSVRLSRQKKKVAWALRLRTLDFEFRCW
ncbi:MAG: DUF448 domain-containing protein [Thermodesulfobacteriota bacterium]